MEEILKIEHLVKDFGTNKVLKDIDFSVYKGDVISIIGSSGSGKSTLLRCINMLEDATGGSIFYHGKDILKGGVNEDAFRTKVGMVFQSFNLFNNYTVLENCIIGQTHALKRSKEEAEEKAYALLKRMSLADKAKSYPCELSGGQMQRVSIARALALDPEILFFDEPTSALDPELTREILNVIRSLAEEKMTMVVVTHEMNFAKGISDHAIFMEGGYIVEEGDPISLFENPQNRRTQEFVKSFE